MEGGFCFRHGPGPISRFKTPARPRTGERLGELRRLPGWPAAAPARRTSDFALRHCARVLRLCSSSEPREGFACALRLAMAHAPRAPLLSSTSSALGDIAEPLALAQLQGCIRDSARVRISATLAPPRQNRPARGGVQHRLSEVARASCASSARTRRAARGAHARRVAQREPVRLTVTRIAGKVERAALMAARLRRRRCARRRSSAPGADSDLRRQIAELSQAALE